MPTLFIVMTIVSLTIGAMLITSANSNYSVPHLLSAILNDKQFSSCEVIFVRVNEESSSENTFAQKINPMMMPTHDSFLSSGTFTVSRKASNMSSIIKYKRLNDIHRLNDDGQCGVAILYLSHSTPGLKEWLFETIIPLYVPIIRKDEDHFLFVFNNEEDANEILLSPSFGNKIKFKLGIVVPTPTAVEEQESNNSVTSILQVDLFAPNGECTINVVDSFPFSNVNSLFADTKNFNAKLLRVVNPKSPSYFEMTPEGNGNTYRPDRGLYKVWLDTMIQRFNFTITLTLSSASGSTGKRLKNGTWVGSVGDILAERADLASFNGHIANRHQLVDWSAPITYEWMVFITHKPKSFFSPSAVYRPFPKSLWIGFLISVVLICINLKVFAKFAYTIQLRVSTQGMLMFLFSSFMEQDAQKYIDILHLHSVRVLTTFWLFVALILSTAYRGKLVSLIAFPALSWVPVSFDDLAYSDYRVGLNVFGKGGATYAVLSTSNSPVYQTFFRRMEVYPDPVKCLSAAFYSDLGCLMVKSVADFYGAKNFTDKFGRNPFQASEQTALFREDGYIWEKRAVFRKHLDKLTWLMVAAGLTNQWFHNDLFDVKKKRLDWERQNPGRNSSIKITYGEDGPSKLQFVHLMGLFYLYFTGHLVGILWLFWEKLGILRNRWKLQQKHNHELNDSNLTNVITVLRLHTKPMLHDNTQN